jgi:hypothetical protein
MIHGIKNMNDNTVPFYYNQIVDRLNSQEELNLFYNKIAANCKPLMWLNLYLTGLSIFYGGMVARKLRKVTEENLNIFNDSKVLSLLILPDLLKYIDKPLNFFI